MPLNTRVAIGMSGVSTKALTAGGSAERPFSFGVPIEFKDGSGANQANKIYSTKLTIGASANVDIDLAGTLENDFGDAVVFAAIKGIYVRPTAGANPAVVGGAAATQFVGPFGAGTHTISVPQGGAFCIANPTAGGWTLTGGASDLLRIANGAGASIDVEVVIIGI
jgi:hypothetical protein